MASSLATVASASVTKPSPPAAALHQHRHDSLSSLSFPLSLNPKLKLRFFSKGSQSSQSRSTSTMLRSELNEGTADGSSNDAATPTGSEFSPPESRDSKPSNEPASAAVASEESISEFITQVASLVKLVDSRDVVELQMKQLDCEVIIRKKEAMPQPPSPAPISMVHSSQPAVAPPPTAPTLPAPASSAPAQLPSTPARKSSKSSLPPLKSPMAGTFYRSPAPGEPAFVKVGDKVQKGQVLCIIEAMKLMNEIEADQSGTIVEVVAEDGKPVSVDTPLFVIQP